MKLTTEQRSEIISEMGSSEAGFNELMRVLLDSFSKQERTLFLEEHKGEQGNGFRPRRWRGHGCSFGAVFLRKQGHFRRKLPCFWHIVPALPHSRELF